MCDVRSKTAEIQPRDMRDICDMRDMHDMCDVRDMRDPLKKTLFFNRVTYVTCVTHVTHSRNPFFQPRDIRDMRDVLSKKP